MGIYVVLGPEKKLSIKMMEPQEPNRNKAAARIRMRA